MQRRDELKMRRIEQELEQELLEQVRAEEAASVKAQQDKEEAEAQRNPGLGLFKNMTRNLGLWKDWGVKVVTDETDVKEDAAAKKGVE
eukprot:2795363-Rhodomonas_salina.1